MIPDREETFRSLFGAYRLACMDPGGMAHFNLTVEGFWRSFFAVLLVAPGYFILVTRDAALQSSPVGLGPLLLIQTIAYLAAWAAFPLAALVLTQLLSLTRNYVPLIVAANWAAVIQIVAFLAAISVAMVLPGFLGGLVLTVVTIGVLFYQWFLTRTALQTTGAVALLFVLVDLLLNVAITNSADRLTLAAAPEAGVEATINNPPE